MIRYKTISTTPDFDVLAGAWNSLLDVSASHVPFLRHEYLMAWWQTLGGGEWDEAQLNIIVGTEGDQLVGIAPLFRAKDKQGTRGLWFLGSIEVSDYLDILVRPGDALRFCEGMLKYLSSDSDPYLQRLDLYNILEDSKSGSAIKNAALNLKWDIQEDMLQHSPFIPLNRSFDQYLAGIEKKQRHEIRRKRRRLENSTLKYEWYTTRDEKRLPADVDSFLNLMAFDAQKASFLTPLMKEHMKNVITCAFQADCLHLFFLVINGVKVAGSLSFDYLGRLWLYNSGIHPEYGEFSPGWLILAELIQWACEQQYEEFDFMRGDEEYKYRFGAQDRFIKRLLITCQAG